MKIAITGSSGHIGGRAPDLPACEARPFACGDCELARQALSGVDVLFNGVRHRKPNARAGTPAPGARGGILRAIAAKPDILLMDEPFSAPDPLARASLQETMSLIH